MSATIATSSASIQTLFRGLCTTTRIHVPRAVHSSSRPHRSLVASRLFAHATRVNYPRKDSQDKDSINTEATEYSKSSTDDDSARQEDAAFNPNVTDPQEQKDLAGKNREVDPQSQKETSRIRLSNITESLLLPIFCYIDGGCLTIREQSNAY